MKTQKNNFTTRLLVFTLVLAMMAYGLGYILPQNYLSPVLFLLFPFFFSATAIMFLMLAKTIEKKPNSFINLFMIATFLKLMVYMAVLLAYTFTHKEDAVPFIMSFFILYVMFTVFEVMELLRINKK